MRIYRQIEDADPTKPLTFTVDAKQMFVEWEEQQIQSHAPGDEACTVAFTRVPDMVKRLLIVLCVTNNVEEVDAFIMRTAIAFGEYQLALRLRFNPRDADTWVQAAQNAILAAYEKHNPLTQRECYKCVHGERLQGGINTFHEAWVGLMRGDEPLLIGETVSGSQKKYYMLRR
jgi:hypothetical protein